MRTLLSCTAAMLATGLLVGVASAEPDAYLSDDGRMTFARGSAAHIGDALLDPMGCNVIDETFNDTYPVNCCGGWTISDGYVGCQSIAASFVVETEIQACEMAVHVGHVTGPNQYILSVYEDVGGDLGAMLASQTFTDEAGTFGDDNPPLIMDISELCLAPGSYFVTVTADGGGGTWGAMNQSTMPGSERLCRWDSGCDGEYENSNDAMNPGGIRLTGTEGCGGGGFEAWAEGDCPGRMTIHMENGTPGGRLGVAYSFVLGAWTIPGGPCAGTELGIVAPTVAGFVVADGTGHGLLSGNVPPAACGRIHVQCVDVTTCTPSNVLSL